MQEREENQKDVLMEPAPESLLSTKDTEPQQQIRRCLSGQIIWKTTELCKHANNTLPLLVLILPTSGFGPGAKGKAVLRPVCQHYFQGE